MSFRHIRKEEDLKAPVGRGFYLKMAGENIKKNSSTYIPYILTCILTVAMYYIIKSLSENPGLDSVWGAEIVIYVMKMGSGVVAIFSAIFLFYTNSFLIKRRKKEFGVYNILGMEKRHLAKVLGWETVYAALFALVLGLVCGIVLDKGIFLILMKIVGGEISLGFRVSARAMLEAILLFSVIFLLIYFNSVRQIYATNPMELLQGGNVGEKEPKSNLLVTLLGIICLGGGYFIALTIKNPVNSVALFFPAAILVIVGTYFLFTSGSIVFLKLLRKNKNYYYKTRHFISVSGMIYRMKKNAVGLANICVLSTMVLVMLSSTSSLMIGVDDMIDTHYPYDFEVSSTQDAQKASELVAQIKKLQQEEGIAVSSERQCSYLNFAAFRQENGFWVTASDTMEQLEALKQINNLVELNIITLEDYNRLMGTDYRLNDGELLMYAEKSDIGETVELFDTEYVVAGRVDDYPEEIVTGANIVDNNEILVVRDRGEMERLCELQKEIYKDAASEITLYYAFDSNQDEASDLAFSEKISALAKSQGFEISLEIKAGSKEHAMSLYGGLFFLGVFLGFLFVIATVLIIYYKQISEGYEDKERYEIMQKVGMGIGEVKASIHSQVLTVFFLPLLMAGIHTAAAFPLISSIMKCMYLENVKLFAMCTAASFLAFGALYVAIYLLNARIYYQIVKR